MIEFQLDATSGVATYLQLVQQVHQALQLGLLEPGDQVPTAQQVVARLAINPNTVLKAYRDLEREGLARARPGHLHRRIAPPHRSGHAGPVPRFDDRVVGLCAIVGAWPRRHRSDLPDGLSQLLCRRCRVTAAFGTNVREIPAAETPVIAATGLGKRYGRRWALRDCTLTIPAGKVVGLVGPNGAGKTTLLHLAVGLLAPTSGSIDVLGGRPAESPAQLGRVGFVAQDTPVFRSTNTSGWAHISTQAGMESWRRAGSSGSASTPASVPGRSPVGSGHN